MFYFSVTDLYEVKTGADREADLEVATSDSLYSERFDGELRHLKINMIVDYLFLAIMNVPLPSDRCPPFSFGHISKHTAPLVQAASILESSNLVLVVQTEQLCYKVIFAHIN